MTSDRELRRLRDQARYDPDIRERLHELLSQPVHDHTTSDDTTITTTIALTGVRASKLAKYTKDGAA